MTNEEFEKAKTEMILGLERSLRANTLARKLEEIRELMHHSPAEAGRLLRELPELPHNQWLGSWSA